MSTEAVKFRELEEFGARSEDSDFLAATQKFLNEMRRARQMEINAIERFQKALKRFSESSSKNKQ